jgi:hypothetical protein
MDKYEVLGRIGEGAHGIVLKGKLLDVRDSNCNAAQTS